MKGGVKDKNNIVAVTAITLILLAVVGIIKCDSDKIEKHLTLCKEICKPDEVIEFLSRKKCFCKDITKEEVVLPLE
jgi:hypothetical protein